MTANSSTGSSTPALSGSDGTLAADHDLILVDLDGVVYLGDQPIDGAAEGLAAAREAGAGIRFVTNNASRPPQVIAAQLESMGVTAAVDEVMSAAIAAAGELARRFPADAPILVVGGAGVVEALVEVGLRPVTNASADPVAVIQGFAPDVGWRALAEATVALRTGAVWIATNTDLTLPSPRGPLPGNGSLVAALAAATGLTPEVIGKPERALFDAAVASFGASRPLMVGDRLDTDIAGARAAGLPSLLVLTGVASPRDLLMTAAESRPDYIGRDLRSLALAHPAATSSDGTASAGSASATIESGSIRMATTRAEATKDGLDGLRALCALVWSDTGNTLSDDAVQSAVSSLDLN